MSSRATDSLQQLGFQAQEFAPVSLDLTTLGATAAFSVDRLTLGTLLLRGSNTAAVVTAEWSLDAGAAWQAFNPAAVRLGSGLLRHLPLIQANRVRLRVTTADAGGTTEQVVLYADQAPAPAPGKKLLAYARPSNTNYETLYAPGFWAHATELWICNVDAASANASVLYDPAGSPFATNGDNALLWDVPIPPGRYPLVVPVDWQLCYPAAIGRRTSVASYLTFHLFGEEL